MRPLGILAYEDKLVHLAMTKLPEPIFEQDFLPFSYGFRPGRSCHDALIALNRIIEKGKINYVVDADIRGFFDHVNHEWLMKCLEQSSRPQHQKTNMGVICGIVIGAASQPGMAGCT